MKCHDISISLLGYDMNPSHHLSVVLLRIPNPQPNQRILPESVLVRIRESFAAVTKLQITVKSILQYM